MMRHAGADQSREELASVKEYLFDLWLLALGMAVAALLARL
jgi:hypothetical protein